MMMSLANKKNLRVNSLSDDEDNSDSEDGDKKS